MSSNDAPAARPRPSLLATLAVGSAMPRAALAPIVDERCKRVV